MLKKLNIALEEQEIQEAAASINVGEVDSEILDINDTTEELEEELEAPEQVVLEVDEAEEDLEVLDDVEATLEESLGEDVEIGEEAKEEPVSAIAAESMLTSLKIIQNRWGFNTSRARACLATENFSVTLDKSDRVKRTRLALEEIKETKKGIGEGIKTALKKAWDWLVNFVKSTFTSIGRVEERVKQLREKLRATKEDSPAAGKKEVTNKKIASSLAHKNSVTKINFGTIADAKTATEIFVEFSKDSLEAIIKSLKLTSSTDQEELPGLFTEVGEVSERLVKTTNEINGHLPGGYLVEVNPGKKSGFKLYKGETDPEVKVVVPTIRQAFDAVTYAEEDISNFKGFKNTFEKEEAKLKDVVAKLAERVTGTSDETKAAKTASKYIIATVSQASKLFLAAVQTYANYAALAFYKEKGE